VPSMGACESDGGEPFGAKFMNSNGWMCEDKSNETEDFEALH
jgi:hypothetical protein